MARHFSTVIEFINFGKVNANAFGTGVIEFEGFNSIGDGGASRWQRTGVTGLTPSRTPTNLDANEFTDAVGDKWELIPSQIITFNGVQFLPSPFGDAGNGGYYFNGTEFVFLASAADEAAAAAASAAAAQVSAQRAEDAAASIEGQLTTTQLIASSLTLDVGDTIQTNGFYTAGDGGGALWVKTASTDTPSQTPADMADATLADGSGSVWGLSVDGKVIKPAKLGGGFGFEDGVILNICFQYLRDNVSQDEDSASFDGEGKTYNTSISINATKIVGWNWSVKNAIIYGTNTGTITVDFIGSRGGTLTNFTTYGDEDNMPIAGIVYTRSSDAGFNFCSHWNLTSVATLGHYSVAGFYAYGQESTHYDTCKFWNYNPLGRGAVFTGTDVDEQVASIYAGVITGETSSINNKYDDIDARYLPIKNAAAITGASKSNPCVITVNTTIDWQAGDTVSIGSVVGMTELNNKTFEIANVTPTTFELVGVDSSSYTIYSSGGTAFYTCDKPPVYIGRVKDHNFDNLYVVSYGAPHLEVSLASSVDIEQIRMNILFEGFGADSHIQFTGVSGDKGVSGFNVTTYNTHANSNFMKSDGDSTGSDFIVNMYDSNISVSSFAYENINLFEKPRLFAVKACNIHYPIKSLVQLSDLDYFSGTLSDKSGDVFEVYSDTLPVVAYAPTLTSQNGAIGGYTVVNYNYREVDGLLTFSALINIDDIGTATGFIKVSNPKSAPYPSIGTGRENGTTGKSLQCITTGTDTSIRFFDGTTGFGTGDVLLISGSYLT